jgi:hypothetical protein
MVNSILSHTVNLIRIVNYAIRNNDEARIDAIVIALLSGTGFGSGLYASTLVNWGISHSFSLRDSFIYSALGGVRGILFASPFIYDFVSRFYHRENINPIVPLMKPMR